MTLVWLGWTVGELRTLRGESIGAERALPSTAQRVIQLAEAAVPRLSDLSKREQKMIWRFARDMERLAASMSRVVRPGGHLVFVVADSQLKGVPVSNSGLAVEAAQQAGFTLIETVTRPLPMNQRYLPPPESGEGTLAARMREEVIVTFRR
jgi:hypothetical protein